jgi:hypothetical protein
MSRSNYKFRDAEPKKPQINGVWWGIGFILLVVFAVGGFWLAGYLIELNWQTPFLPIRIPRNFTIFIVDWLPRLPGKLILQIAAAVILDILAFSVMVVLYSVVNPIRPGEKDAPQPRGRRRRSLVR